MGGTPEQSLFASSQLLGSGFCFCVFGLGPAAQLEGAQHVVFTARWISTVPPWRNGALRRQCFHLCSFLRLPQKKKREGIHQDPPPPKAGGHVLYLLPRVPAPVRNMFLRVFSY